MPATQATIPHTPAPWGIYRDDTTDQIGATVYAGGTVPNALLAWVPGTEQASADARLIAAAPELLEALQTLLGHVQHYAGMPRAHSDAHRDAANARAAIAKATEVRS